VATALLELRDDVEDYVVTQMLFPFREEMGRRRARETQVREKYGLRSLDYLIQESNQKTLDYQMRQAAGEQVDLPLPNEQQNLKGLNQRRADLAPEIRLEGNLTVGRPRLLGAAVVLPCVTHQETFQPGEEARCIKEGPKAYEAEPAPISGPGMHPDAEIEAAFRRQILALHRHGSSNGPAADRPHPEPGGPLSDRREHLCHRLYHSRRELAGSHQELLTRESPWDTS
jgi:hypothetical protein